MDPRVLDRMLPFLTEQFGNPHSRTHAYGWEAEGAVDEARQHVADLVGAGAKDIVFTSGATESNNMIIKGIAKFHQGKRKHIITTQTVRSAYATNNRQEADESRNINACSIPAGGYQAKVLISLTSPSYPMALSHSPNSKPLFDPIHPSSAS